ncbi:hypothetical protein H6F94_01675 [Leptolyngbya sp. FACHB-261]|nr:hypothetical protein [Leptolyngbya sp. FACHB-261]
MATDYILFIHGVSTRKDREKPTYADELIAKLQATVGKQLNLKPVPLYWGDVNQEAEERLLSQLKDKQGCWEQLWFREFREKQLLQFVGDAALYISRQVGSKVIQQLETQMREQLAGYQPQDRLHLVTHSWGTVILFDLLFAARWTDPRIPGHQSAMAIRRRFYGVEPNPEQGIRLASVHTMGSPIALFSLLDVVKGEAQAAGQPELTAPEASRTASHDITPSLEKLLENLHQELDGKPLPWRNFIHPGDPVAWPLQPLIFSLVDGLRQYLDLQDVVTRDNDGPLEFLARLTNQNPVAGLLNGGNAHGSYWKSQEVARKIIQTIPGATPLPPVKKPSPSISKMLND